MKKFLLILICLILLSGCAPASRIARKDPDKIIKMMEEEYSFILVVSREDCNSCSEFSLTIQQLVKEYKITVYDIVVDDPNDEKMENLINNYLYSLTSIPATFVISNGKVIDRNEGTMDYDSLVTWLKGYGALG